ncbi:lasso peptide biosynthesis B2 protein [Novosphingobium sp. TH158]|uniref:lasso peptide biosynthesis B2 protein n=1 Tax=Novosphingobium sp. TH158 TaxID=2067455 RepID=UPI0013045AE3|nr:lasso peptide biosynthesis B2 protein [Novosphingobium sp. TH158]
MNLQMLEKFWRAPLGDKLALGIAIAVMGLAAGALRILPFRWIALLLGEQVGAVGCVPVIDEREEAQAQKIKLAIARVVAIAPFRSDCLPQAVTAVVMGRIYAVPTALHLGVTVDGDQQLQAHAWTAAGRVAVTGGDCFGKFSIVSCQLTRLPRGPASVLPPKVASGSMAGRRPPRLARPA